MKKQFTVLLCALLAASLLSGCNSNNTSSASSAEPAQPSVSEPAPEAPESEEESTPPSEEEPAIPQEDITVEDILLAIETAYGDEYPANSEIPPEVLETEFGLTPDLYENAKGEMPMISVHNDRVVVVEAVPGKGDDVEQALLDARQRKIEDTLQYPVNIPKTNASKVVRNGDFVAFLLIGVASDEVVDDIESDEAKQYAEEQVQKAVNAFNGMFTA